MAAKVSKISVNYRKSATKLKCCGTCIMFQSPRGCDLVKGVIKKSDVCDRYEKKK